MTWGLDNPDCLYGYTRIRGDARYRITGTRGSARHLEFQVNTGHQSDGDIGGWKAVSALSQPTLGWVATSRHPSDRFETYNSPNGSMSSRPSVPMKL